MQILIFQFIIAHQTLLQLGVEPIGKEESIVEERAGNKVVKGETEVEFLTSNHKILEEANLVGDRCCLFKGDVWHKVDVLHKRNETRVMSKILVTRSCLGRDVRKI